MKRILVVDDDPTHLKLLEEILIKNKYEVVTCVDAAEGLQTAIDQKPNVILLDVMMPVINGYNFCKLIKSQSELDEVKVVMVTSRDQKEDVLFGKQAGADAYLTKPIDRQELLSTLENVGSK